VEDKNGQLQSYAKIKKFAIVPADFTQENGELTPTLKVKRKVVTEKYRGLIDELYR
jgi:long-chain acyl-CoA synthetase